MVKVAREGSASSCRVSWLSSGACIIIRDASTLSACGHWRSPDHLKKFLQWQLALCEVVTVEEGLLCLYRPMAT